MVTEDQQGVPSLPCTRRQEGAVQQRLVAGRGTTTRLRLAFAGEPGCARGEVTQAWAAAGRCKFLISRSLSLPGFVRASSSPGPLPSRRAGDGVVPPPVRAPSPFANLWKPTLTSSWVRSGRYVHGRVAPTVDRRSPGRIVIGLSSDVHGRTVASLSAVPAGEPMPERHEEVVCPFCSLACDDLVVEAEGASLRVVANGCPISVPAFARPARRRDPAGRGPAGQPRGGGRAGGGFPRLLPPAALRRARHRHGRHVGSTRARRGSGRDRRPRGRGGPAREHPGDSGRGLGDGDAGRGANRPDLMLFVGTDTTAVAPRLLERLLRPGPRLVERLERRLVFLGACRPRPLRPSTSPARPSGCRSSWRGSRVR